MDNNHSASNAPEIIGIKNAYKNDPYGSPKSRVNSKLHKHTSRNERNIQVALSVGSDRSHKLPDDDGEFNNSAFIKNRNTELAARAN